MRRFLFMPSLLVIATLLAQRSVPSDNKLGRDQASAPCAVTGRVVTASEGKPVKSALVVLMPEHSSSDHQIYASASTGCKLIRGGPVTLQGLCEALQFLRWICGTGCWKSP